MQALVYHGPGRKSWEEVPDPEITDDAMPSSGSTRPPSAAPTCTSWPATCPDGVADEDILMLADILPTGYEVGVPATFELAVKLARPGGRIANIGVHGKPATLHLEEQWIRDITITTGLVDAASTPTLMRLVTTGQLDAGRFITHRFAMSEFEQAYEVFGRAAETGALKVVLTRDEDEDQ